MGVNTVCTLKIEGKKQQQNVLTSKRSRGQKQNTVMHLTLCVSNF